MNESDGRPRNEPNAAVEKPAGSVELDLPDAPDFVSRPSRPRPLEKWVAMLDQYRRWFPPTAAELERRRKWKCAAEFKL